MKTKTAHFKYFFILDYIKGQRTLQKRLYLIRKKKKEIQQQKKEIQQPTQQLTEKQLYNKKYYKKEKAEYYTTDYEKEIKQKNKQFQADDYEKEIKQKNKQMEADMKARGYRWDSSRQEWIYNRYQFALGPSKNDTKDLKKEKEKELITLQREANDTIQQLRNAGADRYTIDSMINQYDSEIKKLVSYINMYCK